MPRRTEHGRQRHEQGNRPTRQAFQDRENPLEIYQDIDTNYWVYVGANGRTHLFTADGLHHTSFRTTSLSRQQRLQSGRWIRVERSQRE